MQTTALLGLLTGRQSFFATKLSRLVIREEGKTVLDYETFSSGATSDNNDPMKKNRHKGGKQFVE